MADLHKLFDKRGLLLFHSFVFIQRLNKGKPRTWTHNKYESDGNFNKPKPQNIEYPEELPREDPRCVSLSIVHLAD